jgi:hypothetical protein
VPIFRPSPRKNRFTSQDSLVRARFFGVTALLFFPQKKYDAGMLPSVGAGVFSVCLPSAQKRNGRRLFERNLDY